MTSFKLSKDAKTGLVSRNPDVRPTTPPLCVPDLTISLYSRTSNYGTSPCPNSRGSSGGSGGIRRPCTSSGAASADQTTTLCSLAARVCDLPFPVFIFPE